MNIFKCIGKLNKMYSLISTIYVQIEWIKEDIKKLDKNKITNQSHIRKDFLKDEMKEMGYKFSSREEQATEFMKRIEEYNKTKDETSGVKSYKLAEDKYLDIIEAIPFKMCNNDEIHRIVKERGFTAITWLASAHPIYHTTYFMTIRDENERIIGTLFNYKDRDYSFLMFHEDKSISLRIVARSSEDFFLHYYRVEDE